MSSQNNQSKTSENQTEQQKSKADLRRERRTKQEEQRAKKATTAVSTIPKKSSQPEKPVSANLKQDDAKTSYNISIESKNKDLFFETAPVKLKLNRKEDSAESQSLNTKPKLFHHFEEYKRDYSITERNSLENSNIHPNFLKLGLQSAHDLISCSNSRCIGFLYALKQFIIDLKFPSNSSKTLSEYIESKLKPNINFLTQCRPLSVSQGNAIKEMKYIILHLPVNISETEAKDLLVEEIDKFVEEKILLAAETINKYILADVNSIISGTSYAQSKISDNDTILIFGYSNLVNRILIEAKQRFQNIHVIVVDSRPKYRGKKSLEKLLKYDIDCSYILINGISYIMNRVNKVILGAHALMANGYVMAQIGSSQIALVAKAFNVPVIACCETYKFADKVQTDALVKNELGNPMDLLKNENKAMQNEKAFLAKDESTSQIGENLNLLNLIYDVCSPELINCLVTDMGMLPCTSVPVVLRLKNRDSTRTGLKNDEPIITN